MIVFNGIVFESHILDKIKLHFVEFEILAHDIFNYYPKI